VSSIIQDWMGEPGEYHTDSEDAQRVVERLTHIGFTVGMHYRPGGGVQIIITRGGRGQEHSGPFMQPVLCELVERMIQSGEIR